MHDRHDPHFVPHHHEHDSIVADAQFPEALQRSGERLTVAIGRLGEPGFDRPLDPPSHRRGDPLDVASDRGVIREAVGQSGSRLATPPWPPHGVVAEGVTRPVRLLALARERRESEVFLELERVAEQVPRLAGQGRAVAVGDPAEGVESLPLEDDIHTGVLGWHTRSVPLVIHPPIAAGAQSGPAASR